MAPEKITTSWPKLIVHNGCWSGLHVHVALSIKIEKVNRDASSMLSTSGTIWALAKKMRVRSILEILWGYE